MGRAYHLPRPVLFLFLLLMLAFGVMSLWGCGGGDDDTSDDSPAVLLTWYEDADSDGYGELNGLCDECSEIDQTTLGGSS